MSRSAPRDYYSQESLWREEWGSAHDHITDSVLSLIPAEARTILDVGCGNGAVTNFVPADRDVIACDISLAALRSVQRPRCAASIDRLPFPDRAFDLVLATDVLEHIPDATYQESCAELARVTRRWILVAVPYRELLANALVECWQCGNVYHVHWHQRSYDAAAMAAHWQGEAVPVAYLYAGERWIWSAPAVLDLRQTVGGRHYAFVDAVCPHCGAQHHVTPAGSQEAAMERYWESLHHALAETGRIPWPPPSELLVLYDHEAKSALPLTDLDEGPPDLPAAIDPRTLPPIGDPKNYLREPTLIADKDGGSILMLPRLPSRLSCDPAEVALSLYDGQSGRYLELEEPDRAGWRTLPLVAPNRYGYLLHVAAPAGAFSALRFEGQQDPLTHAYEARQGHIDLLNARIESLLALTNDLEARRAAADARLNVLIADNARLEGERHASEARVEELLALSTQLEAARAQADGRVKGLLEQIGELEGKRAGAEARAEMLLALSNTLEGKRAAAEVVVKDLYVQTSLLESRRTAADARVKDLLAQTSEIESRRSAADARVKDLLAQTSEIESRRSAAEARAHALLALSNELEEKRAAAEARVENLLTQASEIESKRAEAEVAIAAMRARLLREGMDGPATFPLLMLRLRRAVRVLVRYAMKLPPNDLN